MSETVAPPPPEASAKPHHTVEFAVVRFAGDSGDGMQLTGQQFAIETAFAGNDLVTLPDFPAEIRAPAGTLYGVSSFQIQFGSGKVWTHGDKVDVLIVMNPAAFKVHLPDLKPSGILIVNTDAFTKSNLAKAGYDASPLVDETLKGSYRVFEVPLSKLTREALAETGLAHRDAERSKNIFALGIVSWLYDRPLAPTRTLLESKFGKKPQILEANLLALDAGHRYAEATELFTEYYRVEPAELEKGTYRSISGNQALAWGLLAAARASGRPMVYGAYPITPASDLLHELANHKNFRVRTFQAEDEISAIGATIGASFGGALGVCGTSGPGLALKGEALGLAVMVELPLVVVNVQRGGPSTGLPTKTEQSDLLQAFYGRNGECPLVILAPRTPSDCFTMAYEAARISIRYMTPVLLLSDGYLATGSEPWKLPDLAALKPVEFNLATDPETFQPYARDAETLARPWAIPGTPGLEHRVGGLEKKHITGNVNYEPDNHDLMTRLREEKVKRVQREIPPIEVVGDQSGQVLVIGWGSTYGAISAAIEESREAGLKVGHVHLRHLNPLPADLLDVIGRFERVLVPEINRGQLVRLLRAEFAIPAVGFNRVRGMPLRLPELVEAIETVARGEPLPTKDTAAEAFAGGQGVRSGDAEGNGGWMRDAFQQLWGLDRSGGNGASEG